MNQSAFFASPSPFGDALPPDTGPGLGVEEAIGDVVSDAGTVPTAVDDDDDEVDCWTLADGVSLTFCPL